MTSSIQRDPIQGLIDYVLDIKPYHSKIAEVNVNYTINDDVRVTILESNTKDIIITEDYDAAFACDEGFGILPFGGPDESIAYIPDLAIDGYISYPLIPLQLPILYIDPFTFAFYNVIAVNPITGVWTVSGNHVTEFRVGQALHIDENSGGGNGGYTILAVAPSGPNTAIFVNEPIPPGASANGMLSTNVGSFFVTGEFSAVILSASAALDNFVLDGNLIQQFVPARSFTVTGTTANDGSYTVLSASYNVVLNQTTVLVTTPVPANQAIDGHAGLLISDIIAVGTNIAINNSSANNGLWRVTSATHETGLSNPPGFDPTANLTEIRVAFVAAFHSFLPLFNITSFSSPYQFDIAGSDFDQHYSVGDAFQIENSTQSYNNSQWIISALTPITGGFRVTSVTHVLDPNFVNLTVSPVLFPLTILPVTAINVPSNLFFVTGNHTLQFGIGTFFNAVDLSNLNPNQGKWQVTAVPIYDGINNVTRIEAVYNQIFQVPVLTFAIVSASNPLSHFIIAGNQTAFFAPEDEFNVTGTALNNGNYIVLYSTFAAGNTTIVVDGTVPATQGATGNVNTEVADGAVLVYARSNWDLPEICKTTSSTTTSSFIGETLEFIAGNELMFFDLVDVEICDLTASIGWGAGGGSEILFVIGGNQPAHKFYVGGNLIDNINVGQNVQVAYSVGNNGTYTITNTFYNMLFNRTEITVLQAIPSATFDGQISYPTDFSPDYFKIIGGNQGAKTFYVLEANPEYYNIVGGIKNIATYSIVSANNGTNTFLVTGNPLSAFAAGDIFFVTGTAANNGTYTVVSATTIGANIQISVALVPANQGSGGTVRFADTFFVAMNVTDNLVPTQTFTVFNATSPQPPTNNGTFTIVAFSFNSASFRTEIIVKEQVPSASFNGQIAYINPDVTANLVVNQTFKIVQSTGNNGMYTISSFGFNSAQNRTEIQILEVIPSATLDGDIFYGPGSPTYNINSPGWDDCGWDTQAGLILYQYRLSVAPPTDTFTTYTTDGVDIVPHQYNEGDVVTVSGALPIPAPFVIDTPYYVHVVTPTTFRLATSSENLATSISSADSVLDIFVVQGDKTTTFTPGTKFYVEGTPSNNGSYIVVSSTYNSVTHPLQTTINVTAVPATQLSVGVISIFITATTSGNPEYQFVEKFTTWINFTSGKMDGSDPGTYLQTYANATIGESISIAVTFGVDAGTVIGSWDYPYWDVGSFDEDVDTLNSLYGSSF